jgi:hypothetical protein
MCYDGNINITSKKNCVGARREKAHRKRIAAVPDRENAHLPRAAETEGQNEAELDQSKTAGWLPGDHPAGN